MKNSAGLILITIGVVMLVWGAFGFKTREKVLDLGPIEATKETTHRMPYAPVVGAILLVGGVVVLVTGRR
jgi:drug/metabolite transporter (DMT)-like permease